jgi:hypothetical protein
MNKKTLTSLFSEAIYQIPDYQRGYAWEEKQWKDFIQDIDALVDEKVTSHYTGTVVVYAARNAEVREYGTKRLKVLDVVDGQQRLTTSCLYLSVIIRTLIGKGKTEFKKEIADFLYTGATCKLVLNNDTGGIFYDLLKAGRPKTEVQSTHGKRLLAACNYFKEHLETQLAKRGDGGVDYLKELFHAITQKLHFTFFTIEEECEIGMTFELMNSRGKGLSVLELLKNYLMHWVSRNETDEAVRNSMTQLINKNWKDVYTNIGTCTGNEDQCLRIAWTLYCNHSPQNWIGYDGFKADGYIPLRNFTAKRTKIMTKDFIMLFADGLSEISSHYASITSPTDKNTVSTGELLWLTKIHHTENIANFLPLIVAARKHRLEGSISDTDYIALLKALECFAYRVFLFDGRRSNAGKSNFHRWGSEVFNKTRALHEVNASIYELVRYYAPEDSFTNANAAQNDWYARKYLLRYTLFEYELNLLQSEGKGKLPHLKWEDLNDSTIEHILPQTPEENSHWKSVWSPEDIQKSEHDIGNLVLTQNNSNYKNFEFVRKKGAPGVSPSYSNSDIRQERKIAAYADWTPSEFDLRRTEIVTWINDRWKTEIDGIVPQVLVDDEADEDSVVVRQ